VSAGMFDRRTTKNAVKVFFTCEIIAVPRVESGWRPIGAEICHFKYAISYNLNL
jgi:hypothetical protein